MELPQSLGTTQQEAGSFQSLLEKDSMNSFSQGNVSSRKCIALNNHGVSLLVRGAYRPAFEAFKDSFEVLKTAHVAYQDCCDLDLARKSLALAFSHPQPPSIPSMSVVPISHNGIVFHGLDFTMGELAVYSPIWIECPVRNVPAKNNELSPGSFQLSIILYNYALAHLCLAQEVRTCSADLAAIDHANLLTEAAICLLEMVLEILDDLSESTAWSPWTEEARLTMASLALTHIMTTAAKQGKVAKAARAYQRLSVAADAWQRWSFAMTDSFDNATVVSWKHGNDEEHSEAPSMEIPREKQPRLHLRHRMTKAPAA
jgi:tetratricopeptide (TPR) repeat protein